MLSDAVLADARNVSVGLGACEAVLTAGGTDMVRGNLESGGELTNEKPPLTLAIPIPENRTGVASETAANRHRALVSCTRSFPVRVRFEAANGNLAWEG